MITPWIACGLLALPPQDPASPAARIDEICDLFTALADADRYGQVSPRITEYQRTSIRWLANALRGDSTAVVTALQRGVETLPKKNAAYRAFYRHFAASTLADLGFHTDALQFVATVKLDSDNEQTLLWQAKSRSLHAQLQRVCGNAKGALATARELAARLRSVESANHVLADALGESARVHIDLGVLEVAARECREQSTLAERSGDPVSLRLAGIAAIELALAQGRVQRVRGIVDRIRRRLGAANSAELTLLEGLAMSVQGATDPSSDIEAARLLDDAIAQPALGIAQRNRARIARLQITVRAKQFDRARRGLDALRQEIAGNPRASDLRADLEALASRAARLGEATDAARRTQLKRNATAVDALIERWAATPMRAGGIGFLAMRHRRYLLSEWFQLDAALNGQELACQRMVELLLRLQALSSSARDANVSVPTIDQVRQQLLAPGEAALLFLAAQDTGHLFAVDRNRIRYWPLPGWVKITQSVDAYFRELSLSVRKIAPDRRAAWAEKVFEIGRKTSDTVLPKELHRVMREEWRVVNIVDHGLLRRLPFECLLTEEGQLLGQVVGVNTLASIPLGLERIKANRLVKTPAARVTVTTTLSAKELAADDLSRMSDDYAQSAVRRIETVRELTELGLDGTVTQIFAHGTPSADLERRVGIAFRDATLTADIVERWAQTGISISGVFVLSVCEAADSRLRIGDGSAMTTLGGAFLRAGAHTVIQSPVDLLLASHLELTERMHAHIASGESVARALQLARAKLARSASRFEQIQHALVQVFGIGGRPVVE